MFEITTEASFSAAHRLKNYDGPCEHLHGHNWLVRATVKCSGLDNRGIGIDFRELRGTLKKILDRFDHKDLNEVLGSDLNPSSENLAKHIFELLKTELHAWGGSVARVEVFETPGNSATYYE